MSGGSPGGVAENGTRSGKEAFALLVIHLVFPNLLPYCHFTTLGLTRYSFITVVVATRSCGIIPPPGVGSRLGLVVWSGVRALPGRSPTGLAESRCSPGKGHFRYGLLFRLWLLSTLSIENAVTIDYGEVTISPIGTFTR